MRVASLFAQKGNKLDIEEIINCIGDLRPFCEVNKKIPNVETKTAHHWKGTLDIVY